MSDSNQIPAPETVQKDIFERLRNGETISSNDPEAYKMTEASYMTKKLLVQMNSASSPDEIRNLLSRITDSEIDGSVNVLRLYTSITENTRKSAETYSSILIVCSWI